MNLSDALGIPKDITPSHQVIITDLEKTIQTFIKTVYKKRLAEIKLKFKRSEDIKDKREITLDIQYSDVYAYHSLWSLDGFGDKLLDIPDRTIPELKSAVLKLLAIPGEDHDIPVHLVDINPKKRIRDIREADLGRMIAIEGICKKMSPVRPRIKTAVFRCHRGHIFSIPQQYGYFKQPPVCQEQGCTSRQLEHQERHSDYINSQVLTVQESPEGLIGGQQPESLRVDITNELCGLVVAGDRVVINGVVRTHPKSIRGGASSTFEIYIEAHSIERLEADYSQLEIYEEDEQRIQELAKDPDIHALLAASISPDIWGHLDVKSAIAFQLFGGVSKTEVKETTSEENPDNKIKVVTHTRGDIHILLIGDPGMAKSKMIRYVAQLAPRSVYTTGLSSSKAG
ncbi:MAG: minichromosome maintenance protein MCM, partial [Methanospirillaceae archaeon]|nr:minichromosome maintenance protein MCM [Methanospirillaceae archaeon]